MQRRFRLTRSEDFKRVRRYGKSYAHPLVVLIVLKNEKSDHKHVRVGVAAGRTVGTAVARNRAKRLLREAIRSMISEIESGMDMILIARAGLVSATLDDTRKALRSLLQRAQIITPRYES